MERKNSDKFISDDNYSAYFQILPVLANKIRQFTGWIFIALLLILFSSVVFPSRSYAVPAYEEVFELKQPSGFSFEARQFGDEWYNFVETKDGFGVYKNAATGVWEYYLPSSGTNSGEDGAKGRTGRNRKARRGKPGDSTEAVSNVCIGRVQDAPVRIMVGEADPIALGIPKGLRPPRVLGQNILPPSLPTELEGGLISTAIRGSIPLLVIGVDYADAPATYTAGQIQPLLFGTSDSVSDYYNKTSYSSVTITTPTESHGTSNDGFVGWLRLTGNHPNTGLSGWNSTANQQIAKDAILAADPSINFAQYDTNENGVVEPTELSVMIIVAGYEASYGSYSPSVWAHCWGMYSVGYPTVDGKTIVQYALFGEKHGDHLATFGVMAHELGHLMYGLPDLYDTDTSNGDSAGVGYFDLMGTGSWGAVYGANAGSSPTQLSAWCKEYLSWGVVNTILSSQSVYFPKTDGNSSAVSRINTADSNQYFLLENRQFTGYDKGFEKDTGASGHGGLVIYHIDKLKTPPQYWYANADENDKGVDVEEANEGSLGYSMLDTNSSWAHTNMFFFSGNNTSFTNTTTPGSKLKNGIATNIFITDVSSYGDTMAATVVLPSDTISPTVVITSPTSESTYTTTNSIINLGGTASDNVGVTMVTWSNDRGGSDTATGTTSWSVSGIALQSGTNVITVTARDAANNTGTDTLTVTYNPPDTISPSVTITSPTSESAYTTTSSSLNLGGTASDNVGVTQVTWSNSRGGSGTANGTTSWSVSGITLQSGTNIITVTARDAANNIGTDTLTVTYNPPDTISPSVTITSPTSESTYTTTSSSLNLGGTASDNVGVTQVTWSNSRGGSGTANGTTSWSVSGIALQSGTNVITVTARDAANNIGTDTLTVTYNPPDTISPSVTITSPTSESTYTTTSGSLNLGGTASDNVGVTQVTWSNDRGGSDTANGTTSWSVSGIALQSGTNVITVTARDAANNTGTDTLTVTYSESTFIIQPGPEGIDTCYGTIYATSGTPDSASLYIGGWGDWYYDFFWFDLTGSPSAAETVSAKLYLYGSAPNDPGFKLNRITESWTEAGVALANNPASVFYKKFGSFAVGADGWSSMDITKLYKNWKKGRYPNYGVKLVPTRNSQTNGWIVSSDHENSAIRPKMIVTRRTSKDVIEAGSDMSRK